MLGGGVWLATKFDWIFYLFGGYLAFQGLKMLYESLSGDEEDEEEELPTPGLVRFMRKFVRIVEGDHGGKFKVVIDGRTALTTVAVCLVAVELTDVVFALDSIPAVLSVSQETFIIVTSNIFAILGLRSLYFVLAGAMAQFKYLEMALGVLLVGIGAKMILHNHVHIGHVTSLIGIAGILSTGVIASLIHMKRNPVVAHAPEADAVSGPGPASPSP
jgi:tellurite resistance protein TerC